MTQTPLRAENRPIPVPPDPASIKEMVGSSIRPGASVLLVFYEGMVSVFLDRLGDWTITVAMATRSTKLEAAADMLEELGFFKATEQDGKVYYLWTSALRGLMENREMAEEILLKALQVLQTAPRWTYIS